MNKENKGIPSKVGTKKILALMSAVAIGIAMFAAVGILSSPQQAGGRSQNSAGVQRHSERGSLSLPGGWAGLRQ